MRLRDRLVLRFVPEPRLALAVGAAALLWLLPGAVGRWAGLAGLAAVAAALAWDFVFAPTPSTLTIHRELGGTVGIGERIEGEYRIESAWPRALAVELHDRFPAEAPGGVGVARLEIPPFGSVRVPFHVTGERRGRWASGPIAARVRSSLALLGTRYSLRPQDDLRVIPSVGGVKRFRLLAAQHRLDTIGVRSLRRRGEGGGFDRLREYALGDDPRHMDWKATARRLKPIVREFTIERSQTVFTLLDAGRGMTQQAGDLPRFEHALSAALVLTDVAAAAGDHVGTMVFDDEVRAFVPARRSASALRAVRDAFVPVTATTREPDYAGAFRFLATHQRKRALIVFFTDVIDVRASKALLAHAGHSAARHLVLIVALRNDAVFDAATPGSGSTEAALYGRAAAEELILGREEALEGMRRTGAVVLDVSPRAMTAAVVNRYLELKSRGSI